MPVGSGLRLTYNRQERVTIDDHVKVSTVAKRVTQSLVFLEQAEAEFAMGDTRQGAEKLHIHFHHDNMEDYQIAADRHGVRGYVKHLLALVEEYEEGYEWERPEPLE